MCKLFLNMFKQNCRYCLFKSNSFGVCSKCFSYFTYFIKPYYKYVNGVKVISLSRYVSKIRQEILNFKLRDNREISRLFVLSIFNYPNLVSELSKYEYIAYVPMDKDKEKYFRGYNQSKVIANDLSVFLGIPVIDLIIKTKKNKTQSTVKKVNRYLNVKDAYSVKEGFSFNKVLLVDDIFTTGATVFEIINKIKEKYPETKTDVFVLSKTISINIYESSLIEQKYKQIRLLHLRKDMRKRILIERYKVKDTK